MLAFSRICEAATGAIYIDGIGTHSLGLRDVRKSVIVIPQVGSLFSIFFFK